jgi:O-antigen/teichoic acid export membrane protein
MLRQPLDAVSLPLYARLQEDRVLLARTVLHAQELVLAVCCPLTIGLACVAPVVLEVVVGPKWLPAAPILRVLACLEFVAVLTTFAYPVLMATGRPGAVTLLLVAQAAGVPLAALAGVRWGTTGVATGLLAISVMGAGLALVLTQRAMPLSLISFSTVHLRPFVATAGMAASVLLVLAAFAGQTAFARLLLAIFAGAISYVGLSLVVSPRVSADLLSMARMTMRRSVIAEIGAIRTAG